MTISGHGHREPSHYLRANSRNASLIKGGTQLGLEQFPLTVETPDCALGDACITSRGPVREAIVVSRPSNTTVRRIMLLQSPRKCQ
jgi:hypothetical protein